MSDNHTRWYFGYRCELSTSCFGDGFVGVVCVPGWHPVRVEGFDDGLVFLIGGEWIVTIDEFETFPRMLRELYHVARGLRTMQKQWDKLSPYEREYRIW